MSLVVKLSIGIGCLAVLWFAYAQVYGMDEIEYRNTKIKLTKKYIDYDAYKNDQENIAKTELPRIEKMIVDAKISRSFKDFRAFANEAGELKVPGYGFGGGPKVKAEGREFVVSSVEIPTQPWSDKNRYFVLEKLPDGSMKLVDDFVSLGHPILASVELHENKLIYRGKSGVVVRETTL